MTDPTKTAQQLIPYATGTGKPILASWMGGSDVATGERILSEAGVATFPYPDSAAHMFTELVHYSENLKSLYETPGLTPDWVRRAAARPSAPAHRAGPCRRAAPRSPSRSPRSSSTPTASRSRRRAPRRPWRRPSRRPMPSATRSWSSSSRTPSPTSRTSAACAWTCRMRRPCARPTRGIEEAVADKHGPEHFEGVSVQPMIDRDGYELIIGSSVDCAVRPGAAVRPGRRAGRGLQGPRAGPAAADRDAGAPDDGAHQGLHGPQGRARPAQRRHGRA